MPTTLFARFVSRFMSDDKESESADSPDESMFVPSRLDYTVRKTHSSGHDEAAREIRDIQEQAANQDPRNH